MAQVPYGILRSPQDTLDSAELQQLIAGIGDALLARRAPGPPASSAPTLTRAQAAALIDHTILRPDATARDVERVCGEALAYGFASVCVNAVWTPLVAAELARSKVKVCTVVGFPLGASPGPAKLAETELALRAGAAEIDMVMHVGALKGGDWESVKRDIQGVARLCHGAGALLKVILETALLDDYEKAAACVLARMAEADFVKTSTGFSRAGATAGDVRLMRAVVGPELGVKASGGIRTLEDLLTMVAAGASRIGASASVQIVEAIG